LQEIAGLQSCTLDARSIQESAVGTLLINGRVDIPLAQDDGVAAGDAAIA
jgi:hypothetical protein